MKGRADMNRRVLVAMRRNLEQAKASGNAALAERIQARLDRHEVKPAKASPAPKIQPAKPAPRPRFVTPEPVVAPRPAIDPDATVSETPDEPKSEE
jgi:hypothetical protein